MRLPSLSRFVALVLFTALFLVLLAPGCGRSSLELETPTDGGTVVPKVCGPATCPAGCCDASGVCRTGSDTRACGSAANRCSDCIANGFQFCDGRRVCGRTVTSCGPSTCPGGCCSFDGGGAATCLSGTDPNACGRSGSSCQDCGAQGRTCDPATRSCGEGKCDASNCSGCCVGDQCLKGADSEACGSNGQLCESCSVMGQFCRPEPNGGGTCEGAPTCGPQNCGGCCNGNTCVAGSSPNACGKQGMACTNCTATGRTCVPQGQPNERTCQLVPTCNAATCPGCCVGNNCVVATTPAACGKGGQMCTSCKLNDTCTAGVCTPQVNCGPGNCAGCCIGTNLCATGNQNTACGLSGIQCNNCTGMGGQVCQGGTCNAPVCGPGNCAGCCSGNTCVLGTQDNACGGPNGAACVDCLPGNQVCQGRVCRPRCGPLNCAGCCNAANACAVGFTNAQCGSGGAACLNCSGPGGGCNTFAVPRVCANMANMCPAAYPNCPAGISTGITASLQGVCDDAVDLDSLQAACAGGPNTGTCIAAFQVLAAANPACNACIKPFNEPFAQFTGIYRCAAPFVTAACNRSTGCAIDCQDDSCTQCPAGTEDQCRNQVNAGGGQCNGFITQTATCVAPAIPPGTVCHPATYGFNFGSWLRGVGDHFCGNGP